MKLFGSKNKKTQNGDASAVSDSGAGTSKGAAKSSAKAAKSPAKSSSGSSSAAKSSASAAGKSGSAAKNSANRKSAEGFTAARARSGKRKGFSGVEKGLLLLAGVIVVLIVVIVVGWSSFAEPPDISSPSLDSGELPTERPGAAGLATSYVDPDSGDEVEVTERVEATTVVTVDAEGNEITTTIQVPVGRKEDFYTFMVVGTDKGGGNTDTILVGAFDVANRKLNVVSIPRDTLVNVSWYPYKINAAYAVKGQGEAGLEGLKNELQKILGIPIDGYVMVDLDAFVQLVDLIGGVNFNVPQRMLYTDPTQNLYIDLYAGEQLLDGNKAIQLVRFRSYAAGDLQRIQVQQEFMTEFAKQALTIGNITKVTELAEIVSENVFTNFSVRNVAFFIQEGLKLKSGDISFQTLPGNGQGYWNGLSYYYLYGGNVVEMVNECLNPYTSDITTADVNIVTISGGVMVSSSGRTVNYTAPTYQYGYVPSTKPEATPAATPEPDVPEEEIPVEGTETTPPEESPGTELEIPSDEEENPEASPGAETDGGESTPEPSGDPADTPEDAPEASPGTTEIPVDDPVIPIVPAESPEPGAETSPTPSGDPAGGAETPPEASDVPASGTEAPPEASDTPATGTEAPPEVPDAPAEAPPETPDAPASGTEVPPETPDTPASTTDSPPAAEEPPVVTVDPPAAVSSPAPGAVEEAPAVVIPMDEPV